ncbi:NERD domain-containing protein [Slackia heliotrinireducens]|uniref:NERD domain-containing protein n=1 Tax=Slackia heliotrinireducens (strain ATCC 29202 / DSM 20476 / NCTC 11029 / RHS 1) TaxID=471855 RepID=C7N681_SLAHD|nr:NERD domain-containing protein [Slackia heliotrinireducens]ACV22416.1 hypothetical protein Shel_13950 [Slackia heliotrinireducens DSM 20476]
MSEDIVNVRCGIADKSHENEFFRYFARAVKAFFEKKGIDALLIGMPKCLVNQDLQIDALLITDSKMIIIDFKDYSGELTLPDEQDFRRGRWETSAGIQVKGGSSPNPFYQTGLQRERLARILETFCRNLSKFNPRHITTMVCFQGEMDVFGVIPGQYRPCFFIADRGNYLEKLYDIVSVGDEPAGLLGSKFLDYFNDRVFKSEEYDLTITPESLGVLPKPIVPEGKSSIDETIKDRVAEFFVSDIPVLAITGTVGSGKAAISSEIREAALDAGFSSARVFALSNRVKHNLLGSIDEVESLYSAIFDFSSTKVAEDGSKFIPLAELEEPRAFDDLDGAMPADDKPAKTAFIIYESQMVTDSMRVGEAIQFGSGKLLSDLLEHLGIGEDKLAGNKVVFVGDKFQLGFGSWSESCLNPEYYRGRISMTSIELPDTQTPTGIQQVCLDIANAIRIGRLSHLVLTANDQLAICGQNDEAKLLREAESDWRSHKVLSYTNSQSCGLNGYIKRRIRQNGPRCSIGDIIIFENEVLAYPSSSSASSEEGSVFQFGSPEPTRIPNGTFGTIVGLGNETSIDVDINGSDAPIRLTLVEADVRLNVDGFDETLEIRFIKELLESEDSKLSTMEDIALRIHVEKLFREALARNPFEKSSYYKEMIDNGDFVETKEGVYRDPKDKRRRTSYEEKHRREVQKKSLTRGTEYYLWSNAAQVKYGWCMTVHKAMSYKWNTVTFSTRIDGGRRNENYFRFLYTGISRAEEHVNLVRWEPVSPFEKTEFGTSGQGAPSACNDVIFRATGDDIASEILAAVGTLEPDGFKVSSSKLAQYQVICEIEKDTTTAKVIFYYNKKGEVTRLTLSTGDKELFADFRAAFGNGQDDQSQASTTPMKWLYDHLNEGALADSVLEIEESSNYLDILKACQDSESVIIRANYRKDQTVSNFKYLSGSMTLYEHIVSAIKTYYALD